MGPTTIFDKSALQSFSMDESVWFDAFLMANVTPLFFIETLADLEKSMKLGKSPEEFVGMLAYKVPFDGVPNVHHFSMIEAELRDGRFKGMDGTGRPILANAKPKKNLDGTFSVHFDQFPEAAALTRWHQGDFLEIERATAKEWRRALETQDNASQINKVKYVIPPASKVSDLEALKLEIDKVVESSDVHVLQLALDLLGVPEFARAQIIERWECQGCQSLKAFAPYTAHVFSVDLMYYLGIDRGFISDVRASNKADMAYLYYLPFCQVFVSDDNLHVRTVPLFLRDDQTFVAASEMKKALKEFDDYYSSLPDEVKALGVWRIAGYPPVHMHNVVTDIWDKNMRPDWREISQEEEAERIAPRKQSKEDTMLVDDLNRLHDSAVDLGVGDELPNDDNIQQIFITRWMSVQKGKWRLISKEQEDAIKEAEKKLKDKA